MMETKNLKNLSLKEQLLYVESFLPDAWEYLHDISSAPKLPQFDDNDNFISAERKD